MNSMQIEQQMILSERPFTHPGYTPIDMRQICYMLMRLSQIVNSVSAQSNPNLLQVESHELIEADGRHHRIIPIRPKLLLNADSLTIVGFFGQRNLSSDGEGVASRDKMLFTEMRNHPGLLSYSSLELTNGDYGNCVIFLDEGSKDDWGYSQVHAEAVQDLSPKFYQSVRLYNGSIPGDIYDYHRLKLNVVKYFDYSDLEVWAGNRALS